MLETATPACRDCDHARHDDPLPGLSRWCDAPGCSCGVPPCPRCGAVGRPAGADERTRVYGCCGHALACTRL